MTAKICLNFFLKSIDTLTWNAHAFPIRHKEVLRTKARNNLVDVTKSVAVVVFVFSADMKEEKPSSQFLIRLVLQLQ